MVRPPFSLGHPTNSARFAALFAPQTLPGTQYNDRPWLCQLSIYFGVIKADVPEVTQSMIFHWSLTTPSGCTHSWCKILTYA